MLAHAKNTFLLNSPDAVCRAYSEGRISWRKAAFMLGLADFTAFEQELHSYGFTHPQPDNLTSRQKMASLEALMYDEGEI